MLYIVELFLRVWIRWDGVLTCLPPLLTQSSERLKLSVPDMSAVKSTEVPYGALDLLILKTLETMGSMHGYAIARRIEQVVGDSLRLSQGSVYPALIRLQQEGWIAASWGMSETNRKVKFYSLTRPGRKQIVVEVSKWEKATALVARFLAASS